DPFTEKLLLEACLELMASDALIGIQDMGAAGLTSSSVEMAGRAGSGLELDLDAVPRRETGMTPYELMLSESQERMLLVAEKGREREVFAVFKKWGLDAVTIGVVTDDGKLRIRHHGKVEAEIPNKALADEAPKYDRPHNVKPYRTAPLEAPAIPESSDLAADLLKLTGSPDLCSKRWIWEQYDYLVRSNTLAGPGSDAAVIRVKETDTSIAMSLDGNGRYCYLDPREGAKLAVAECCRNLATVGAVPVAATNNLNFGNPERPEIMAQLVEAIEGIGDACRHFEAPITGGNVSLYNETLGEGIYPTPVLGIIGLVKTAKPIPTQFQAEGASLILLGGLRETTPVEFGGSEYAKVILNQLWGLPPKLDMDYEKRVHDAMREIAAAGLAESAHDLSDGGLAVALAECCSPEVGANVKASAAVSPVLALFGESPSRILVSTRHPKQIEEIMVRHGVEGGQIGVTIKGRLQIQDSAAMLIDVPTQALIARNENALPELLHDAL
ncbi:MAG: phosphoribosylformylglycinamidine synthase II, partial [Acidobacteriota bacterium]|nr:phosphoribosylformylglycinamidine synthase II [Acidobacteriota bacterium]